MKTIKILTLTAATALIALPSCSKYEENEGITLKSKKERVANTWKIDKAFNDGEDVTDEYDEYTLTTTKDGDANLMVKYEFGAFSFEAETQGTWQFESGKENIAFDYENDDADAEYQLLRLEEDNMWLREKGGEDELRLVTK